MKVASKFKPRARSARKIIGPRKRGMKLQELIAGIDSVAVRGSIDLGIVSIECDSRKVAPGGLFFALRGTKLEGSSFVDDALRRGAIAIASEASASPGFPVSKVWIQLPLGTDRQALARAAANFYGHPADALQLIGVTGTNGKTTTTYLVDSILRAAGRVTGLIGTTGYRTPKGERDAPNTTPESLELQRIFAEIRDACGTHAILEASSHALAMDRLWGCHFAAAIFTNLTRDHLDYHRTFEEYFAAKRRLFEGTGAVAPDFAAINADDSYGLHLKGLASRTLTYGLRGSPDVTAKKLVMTLQGLEFIAQTPAGELNVRSPLVGRMNAYNILAAVAAGIGLGIAPERIERGIASLAAVPGRFERIDEGQPFLVVVDYAHTDDALRNVISAARELSGSARIITLFGAGGERDRAKRPLMGEAAGSLSDLVVLTSDNPRSEDPLRIINDVVVGLQKVSANYRIDPDRETAIAIALDAAQRGDIVILAGKGHETYQVLRDGSIEFDDREKARSILHRKGYAKERGQ